MVRYQHRIYRSDYSRESVWEALDVMKPGTEFAIADLWCGRLGRRVTASYSMVCQVLRDAAAEGLIECLGRDRRFQGAPKRYRKPQAPLLVVAPREGMQPPPGWRRP